jgi:hypothetical protein
MICGHNLRTDRRTDAFELLLLNHADHMLRASDRTEYRARSRTKALGT